MHARTILASRWLRADILSFNYHRLTVSLQRSHACLLLLFPPLVPRVHSRSRARTRPVYYRALEFVHFVARPLDLLALINKERYETPTRRLEENQCAA